MARCCSVASWLGAGRALRARHAPLRPCGARRGQGEEGPPRAAVPGWWLRRLCADLLGVHHRDAEE
eukprot:11809262-Alexandrium_andersonii.AAC.1